MKLTEERKKYIDRLSYHALWYRWYYSPKSALMQGETGKYWRERLYELSDKLIAEDNKKLKEEENK